MLLASWLQKARSVSPSGPLERNGRRSPPVRVAGRSRPPLGLLEDRTLLSGVSFSAPASFAVGPSPGSVAVGDFNGDGRPDLVVGIDDTNNVKVLLGNGDGT